MTWSWVTAFSPTEITLNASSTKWSNAAGRPATTLTQGGWIEVICGSMFSGKTEELIRRVRRAMLARQPVEVFKPRIDTRFEAAKITSHSAMTLEARVVESAEEIARAVNPETRVVGIDEVQFFGLAIVDVVQSLADRGARVIVAGLDQDYLGRPFEPVPQLLAIAENITKCLAVCARCGEPANRSQRLCDLAGERIFVGAGESYEARCRLCFERPVAA